MHIVKSSRLMYGGKKFITSVWFFPAVLTVLLFVLSLCQISGSSVGVYDSLLGHSIHTIAGKPRPVRSDEWLVNTPLTVSQSHNDYSLHNQAIGSGSDMAVTVDVPYKEWSVLFKPQNLVFLVMPLSVAFAFKWWLLGYILMLAVYGFTLKLFPKRIVLASLLALFVYFSPFLQWWYQSVTLLSVAYVLLIITIALHLTEQLSWKKRLLLSIMLGYVAVCFMLLLYPPFQISAALVGLVVFTAIYAARQGYSARRRLSDLAWLSASLVGAIIIFGLFYISHHTAIAAEMHTVYPGHRVVQPGGMSPGYLLGWPLLYTLENDTNLFGNQSESANFLLFGLLVLPYLAYQAYVLLKSRSHEIRVRRYLLISLAAMLFLVVMRMVAPFGALFYELFGLSTVPLNRMFIGLGIINIVLIGLVVSSPFPRQNSWAGWRSLINLPAIIMAVLSLIYCLLAFHLVAVEYRLPFGVGHKELIGVGVLCAAAVGLLCHRIILLRYIGLCLITLFSINSSMHVNPLYQGLGSLTNSTLVKSIEEAHQSNPSSAWIVSDKLPFESLPVSIGVHSYSGVYPYPQTSLWKHYFPDSSDIKIYNRFAHVEFSVDDDVSERKLQLIQADTFTVHIGSCDAMLKDLHIDYILTTDQPTSGYSCFHKQSTVYAGPTGIFIYKRN